MKEFISRTHLQNYTSLFGVQPADRTHSHLEKIMKITEDIKFLKDISAKRGSDRIHWECCRLMTLEIYQEGECVINFGEVGDSFYIIIEGNASILVPSKMIKRKDTTRENITKSIQRQSTFRINHEDEAENKEIFEEIRSFKRGGTILDFDFLEKIGEIEEVKEIKVLTRGDSFGEVALLSNKPRSATVRCNTLSCFAVLSRKDYKKILSSDAELSVKEKTEYLKHLPIFKHESPGMLRNLSYFITESTFKKNQIVYTEGSSPESIFFIKSGDFKFTVKQQLSTSKNYTSSTLLKLSMLKKNTKTIDLQVVIKGKNQIFGHEEIAEDRLLRVHTCVCESVFGILYVIEINVNDI